MRYTSQTTVSVALQPSVELAEQLSWIGIRLSPSTKALFAPVRYFACHRGGPACHLHPVILGAHRKPLIRLCRIGLAAYCFLSPEAAALEEGYFFWRHSATENRIAVREATKVSDDVAMAFRMF